MTTREAPRESGRGANRRIAERRIGALDEAYFAWREGIEAPSVHEVLVEAARAILVHIDNGQAALLTASHPKVLRLANALRVAEQGSAVGSQIVDIAHALKRADQEK